MTKNIKFNTNKEAIGLLDNLKGSIENKIRTAYNLGYKDGFKEGASKTAKKMLDRLLEDIEPKDEPQTEVVMPYDEQIRNSNIYRMLDGGIHLLSHRLQDWHNAR